MSDDDNPLGPNYSADVANAAIAAVLGLFPAGSASEGVVEPHGAIDGLCKAIAMIAGNTGAWASQRDRRELAEHCRKQIIHALKQYDAAAASWPAATRAQ